MYPKGWAALSGIVGLEKHADRKFNEFNKGKCEEFHAPC